LFAASATHHVHFVEEREQHDSSVIVTPIDDIRVSIYVGFLKVNHLYTIQFPVKNSLGSYVVADQNQNEIIKIVKADATNDGITRYFACVHGWMTCIKNPNLNNVDICNHCMC
jgi:hypothetical protein